MENEDLLTAPEEESGGSPQITDGEPDVSDSAPELTDGEPEISDGVSQDTELEALLSVGDYNTIAVSSIPVGVLCGAIFMLVGFTYLGIVNIFKKI